MQAFPAIHLCVVGGSITGVHTKGEGGHEYIQNSTITKKCQDLQGQVATTKQTCEW
jgi:hypothetical protein